MVAWKREVIFYSGVATKKWSMLQLVHPYVDNSNSAQHVTCIGTHERRKSICWEEGVPQEWDAGNTDNRHHMMQIQYKHYEVPK